jgi:prepilin-type N-terminal cleavage/methylation domain-containing protein
MTNRLQAEDGFTMIEVLVAVAILAIGILGLVGSIDSSRSLGNTAEHEDVASQVAQQDLNGLLTLPYNSLAVTAQPPNSGGATSANQQWNSVWPNAVPTPGATAQPCAGTGFDESKPTNETSSTCLITGGSVAPTSDVSVPATVSGGTVVRVRLFRYITWVNDVACGTACRNASGSLGDYRRVSVAAQVILPSGAVPTVSGTGPKNPIVVSGIKSDPTLTTTASGANVTGNTSPCLSVGAVC